MRDKTYDGWIEARECWRQAQVEKAGRSVGISFTRVENLYRHWWQSVLNPHGWNTKIKGKWAKSMQFEYHEITTLAAQHIKPCKYGPKGQPIYGFVQVMKWFDKEKRARGFKR